MVTVADLFKALSFCFTYFKPVIYLSCVFMITFYIAIGIKRLLVGTWQ